MSGKKKDAERVLGPGAFGDIEHPGGGIAPGLISDEVMGLPEEKPTKENS